MDDMLRVGCLRSVIGCILTVNLQTFGSIKSDQAAISSIHLVENSEVLRRKQQSLLDKHRRHHELEWHDGIEELAPTSMFGGMPQLSRANTARGTIHNLGRPRIF
jgi:hypothetical protein